MNTHNVTTAFLEKDGKVLVARRSDKVGTYRGRWAGISGRIETSDPLDQAYRELAEELGLGRNDVELVACGEPIEVSDNHLGVVWVVHPFLFRAIDISRLHLDWEHTECRWVGLEELATLDTVPELVRAFRQVARGKVGEVREHLP